MIKLQERKFENGLSFLSIRHPHMQGVNVAIYIKSGSFWESKSNNGISHFIEHLLFFNAIQNNWIHFPLNLELNAFTRKDFTLFEITHHQDYLKDILNILCKTISNSNFNNKLLKEQKNSILQEISENKESPFSLLEEQLERVVYPLSLPILGNPENIRSFSLEKVIEWHKHFYTPENMFLVITGNFKENKFKKLLNKNFAKLVSNKSELIPQTESSKKDGKKEKEIQTFVSSYLGISFPVSFSIGSKRYF
jgi:predicted Zn-dependent peptidase